MSAGALPHTTVKSRDQMIKIIALALVFCLSIVLANLSLRYIPVSFNQVRYVFSANPLVVRTGDPHCHCALGLENVCQLRDSSVLGCTLQRCFVFLPVQLYEAAATRAAGPSSVPSPSHTWICLNVPLHTTGDRRNDAGVHSRLCVLHTEPH